LAGGQENQRAPRPKNPMHKIELQHKQIDLEQRRAELNFDNAMRNIQVEKKSSNSSAIDRHQTSRDKNVPGKAKMARPSFPKDTLRGIHVYLLHRAHPASHLGLRGISGAAIPVRASGLSLPC